MSLAAHIANLQGHIPFDPDYEAPEYFINA